MASIVKKIIRMVYFVGVTLTALIAGLVVVIWVQVYIGDTSELKKSTILAKMNQETTVYYADGEQPIGSFFTGLHRRYIPIERVPADVINSIIASEDKNFYRHNGIDPPAIVKAFFEGIQEGRFRRGGSTISQQTVKNILGHWERSFARKFREIIAALQLERVYDKRQILEFYLNQFHVAANGNGIGIAAKYYFNKEVHELTLIEAAFIAGSVKGPSKYNPFIKYTKQARQTARQHAFDRKNYVLRRMYQQGWISADELRTAQAGVVPFQRGKFRSREVSLVATIKKELNRREILDELSLERVEQLNQAGLKIVTTIDKALQDTAQLAMRRNLSRLETILKGFQPESADKFKPLRRLEVEQYCYGKVVDIIDTKDQEAVILDFGLAKGTIPRQSLVRYAKLLDLPEGHREGYRFHLRQLLKSLKVGDVLFTEVKQYDVDNHEAILELHKYPQINGGLIAIDKGNVRTVVSGFNTIGFNRALTARRPPGSVFKAVVYYAALQLGWSILDQLDNERQIFPYQGQFYAPRPDHHSPYRKVSMLWAGIMSENIASVALAYRLVEKLNYQQFKELLEFLDLMPQTNEKPRHYHRRMAKTVGVRLNKSGVQKFQLDKAIGDLTTDLVFSEQGDIQRRLTKIWWGKDYQRGLSELFSEENDELSVREKKRRIKLLANNFTRLKEAVDSLQADWRAISASFASDDCSLSVAKRSIREQLARFRVLPSKGQRPELGYFAPLYIEEYISEETTEEELDYYQQKVGRKLSCIDAQAIWGYGDPSLSKAGLRIEDIKLDGYLSVSLLNRLADLVAERYQQVQAQVSRYNLFQYFHHKDFRISVGLNYLLALTKRMGVTSKLEPVLSYPLGTNDVSAAEVAKLYQTFIEGKLYRFYQQGPDNQLNFIQRIEDRFGKVLYQASSDIVQLSQKENSLQMQEILRKVVTHGTGRRARGELYLTVGAEDEKQTHIRLPAFGKTGTTNDFTTSYFAGIFPYPVTKHAELNPADSYVISAYLGYDLNETMRRGRIRVYGGVGALPLWTDFAKAVITKKRYIDFLDQLNLDILTNKEWPYHKPRELAKVKVDLPRGLILRAGRKDDIEIYQKTDIAYTGETYRSEFAIDGSVRSLVYIPPNIKRRSWQGQRRFSPFNRLQLSQEKEKLSNGS